MASYYWSIIFAAIAMSVTVQSKLVDLSHDHGKNTLDPNNYSAKVLFDGDIVSGVYAKWGMYSVSEHAGTHIDAPCHFAKGALCLESIPLENTIADGVMIDCSEEVEKDPDYSLTLQKVKDWEKKHGKIPRGAAVVLNFNWSHKFNNHSQYLNTADLNDNSTFRYPSVSEEAINFLVDERDINILGVDTLSPDLLNTAYPVHVKMLGKNKILAENVKNPGLLPPKGFRLHASPVKFIDGTGVQTRIFAVIDEDCENGPGGGNILSFSVPAIIALMSVSLFSQLLTH